MPMIVGLVKDASEFAILLGICGPVGGGLGAPATKTPVFRDFSVGDAAAWGACWGVVAAIIFAVLLPGGFLE
jgi:hypothetical protein